MNMKQTPEALHSSFSAVLAEFSANGDDNSQSDLSILYNRLLNTLGEENPRRDDVMRFVLTSLLDHLAEAEGKVAEVLYLYTFRDFLKTYVREPAVQSAIRDYLDAHPLCKPALQIALSSRLKK